MITSSLLIFLLLSINSGLPCQRGLLCLPQLPFLMGGPEQRQGLGVVFPGKVSPWWENRVDLAKLLCSNSGRCFMSQGHAASPMPICYLMERISKPTTFGAER